jgi:hypothetical protein
MLSALLELQISHQRSLCPSIRSNTSGNDLVGVNGLDKLLCNRNLLPIGSSCIPPKDAPRMRINASIYLNSPITQLLVAVHRPDLIGPVEHCVVTTGLFKLGVAPPPKLFVDIG